MHWAAQQRRSPATTAEHYPNSKKASLPCITAGCNRVPGSAAHLRPVAAAVVAVASCGADEGGLSGRHQPHRHVDRLWHFIHPRVELQRCRCYIRPPRIMQHLKLRATSHHLLQCKKSWIAHRGSALFALREICIKPTSKQVGRCAAQAVGPKRIGWTGNDSYPLQQRKSCMYKKPELPDLSVKLRIGGSVQRFQEMGVNLICAGQSGLVMDADRTVLERAVHWKFSPALYDPPFCHLPCPRHVPHLCSESDLSGFFKIQADFHNVWKWKLQLHIEYTAGQSIQRQMQSSREFKESEIESSPRRKPNIAEVSTWSIESNCSSNSTLSIPSGGGGTRPPGPFGLALAAGQLTIARSNLASEHTASSNPLGTYTM